MDPAEAIVEFHYQVPWRSHSAHPGHHFSTQSGGGYELHGHAPLISRPDARRIDIHASLHDPFGQFVVRTFRQRSTIPVYVIADLSASMGHRGQVNKMELLAAIAASVAYSAYRTGDPFGFFGCDTAIHEDNVLPLRWYKGIASDLLQRLRQLHPRGTSARAMHSVANRLGRQRALIFLISDVHFPLAELTDLLNSLSHHDVIPIILWDSMEYRTLPKRGLFRLRDSETGQERLLFMRRRLRALFHQAFALRRHALSELCRQYGREPFFVVDAFDPDALTRYFYTT